MGSEAPPPVPGNHITLAEDKQRATNIANTTLANQQNRPDIVGPNGDTRWQTDPTTGQSRLVQSFGGPLGGAGGAADSLQLQYANAMRNPLTGDSTRQQAINEAYGASTQRLDPQWAGREAAMQQRLQNEGVDPNSEEGQAQMAQLGGMRQDAYSSARNAAIGQGAAGGNSLFRQGQATRAGSLQQMQAMVDLLRQPNFNTAQKRQDTQFRRASRAAGNYATGVQNQNDATNADIAQGGAEGMKALAEFAKDYKNSK